MLLVCSVKILNIVKYHTYTLQNRLTGLYCVTVSGEYTTPGDQQPRQHVLLLVSNIEAGVKAKVGGCSPCTKVIIDGGVLNISSPPAGELRDGKIIIK